MIYHVKYRVSVINRGKKRGISTKKIETTTTIPTEQGILDDWLQSRKHKRIFGDKELRITEIEILSELGMENHPVLD